MSFKPTHPGVSAFRRWGGGPALSVMEGGRVDTDEVEKPAPPPAPTERLSQEEVAELVAEAERRGREEGRAEAQAELNELKERSELLLEVLAPALEEVALARRQALEQAASDVAELVLLFAGRVVDRSLALHPDALPSLVLDAVGQLPDRDEVTIAVAPHLAETLARSLPTELRDRVVADIEIGNGAIVRTRFVRIEATLAHATEGLEKAVKTWLDEQWWAVNDFDLEPEG